MMYVSHLYVVYQIGEHGASFFIIQLQFLHIREIMPAFLDNVIQSSKTFWNVLTTYTSGLKLISIMIVSALSDDGLVPLGTVTFEGTSTTQFLCPVAVAVK